MHAWKLEILSKYTTKHLYVKERTKKFKKNYH